VKTSSISADLVVDDDHLTVDGRERRYRLVRPARPRRDAVVVLALHGSNQTGRSFRAASGRTFDALARDGAVVVYPDAYRRMWNDPRRNSVSRARADGVDDVAFLTALLDRVAARFGLADARAVLAGYSNGGEMALRLMYETTGRLRGVALFGATQPSADELGVADRGDRLPMVLVHGTRDALVPFEGGTASLFGFRPRGTVLSAPGSARFFARRNGCADEPEVTRLPQRSPGTAVEVTRYPGAAPVTLYAVENGGHVVPNRSRKAIFLLGRVNQDVDGGELVRDLVRG
jgi:polyhydroxybutyrate depolymerase